MNNKKLGSDFEKEACKILSDMGYWVHFMTPDVRGAQPFDIIAVKNGVPFAIDCKTSVSKKFSLSRLEDNQIFAFERWKKCGNNEPLIFVKYQDKALVVTYANLKDRKTVDLEKDYCVYEIRRTTDASTNRQ